VDRIAANHVSQETDADGGIPPSQSLDNTHDHTWVTSYMCYMGMDRIIRDLSVADLAAQPVPGAVRVSWTPAFEYPASYYNVLRNTEGQTETPRVNDAPITGDPPYAFDDEAIVPGTKYNYYVEAVNLSGMTRVSDPVAATAGVPPYAFALGQNYPNPFDGRTTVEFAMAAAGRASFVVYDLAGREVYRHEDSYSAGKHVLTLDFALPAGVYLYKMTAGDDEAARKMVITE
jgi:hypothetical protein